MPQLPTQLKPNSEDYQQNKTVMEQQIKELHEKLTQIKAGGPEKARQRQLEQGKLLVRDRIEHLLDTDSSFLELSALAGYQLYKDEVPAGGVIAGIGHIMGQECMIIANDPTVKGGTYYPLTVKKHL